METEILLEIIAVILALISAYAGKHWNTAKNKLSETTNLATKLAGALKTTSEAIEDNKITGAEEKEIVKRWKGVIEQGNDLLKY